MDVRTSRPLSRVLPFFLIGCWFGVGAASIGFFLPMAALFLAVFTLLSVHPVGWLPYRWRWLPGMLFCVLLFFLAASVAGMQDDRTADHHYSRITNSVFLLEVVHVTKRPGKPDRAMAKAVATRNDQGAWEPCTGSLFLYSPMEECVLRTGSTWLVRSTVLPIVPPEVPGQFDFQRWAALKGIYGQLRPGPRELVAVGEDLSWSAKAIAEECRQWMNNKLEQAGIKGPSLALVSALLIGDDSDIDPELVNAFSATGTLHILSVSGMHVAMVYAFIRFLLLRLPRRYQGDLVPWLSILFIWSYAFITGLSPAVQRASATLSLFIVAAPLRRPADSWNLLSASLLLILLITPQLIMNPGFQLSYAAVAGILALSGWLNAVLSRRHCQCRRSFFGKCSCTFRHLLVQSVGISVAAQLFTFPLGLYYFGTFPVYFLPANLVIIPLSTIVLYGAICSIMLFPLPALAACSGVITDFFSRWMMDCEFGMGSWPCSLISGMKVTGIECLLIYLSIVSAVLFILRRKTKLFALSLVAVSMLLYVRIHSFITRHNRDVTVHWKWREGNAVTVVRRHTSLTLVSDKRTCGKLLNGNRFSAMLDELRVPADRSQVVVLSGDSVLNDR